MRSRGLGDSGTPSTPRLHGTPRKRCGPAARGRLARTSHAFRRRAPRSRRARRQRRPAPPRRRRRAVGDRPRRLGWRATRDAARARLRRSQGETRRQRDAAAAQAHRRARQIAGYIATVDVTQQFQNPYGEKIEAVYVFPLPHNAAVNEFVMTIGERHIRGIIRERQEAEQIYHEAAPAGLRRLAAHPGAAQHLHPVRRQHRAGQADRHRHQLLPHARLRTTAGTSSSSRWWSGPRFNPPGSTDGIGAVPRRPAAAPPARRPKSTTCRPASAAGTTSRCSVDIDAGVPIEEFEQPDARHRHQAAVRRTHRRVALHPADSRAQQGLRPALPGGRRAPQDRLPDPPRRARRLLHADAAIRRPSSPRRRGSRWSWSSCSTAPAA